MLGLLKMWYPLFKIIINLHCSLGFEFHFQFTSFFSSLLIFNENFSFNSLNLALKSPNFLLILLSLSSNFLSILLSLSSSFLSILSSLQMTMSSFASDILFDLLELLIFLLVARLLNGTSSSFTSENLSGLTAHAQSFSECLNRHPLATMLLFELMPSVTIVCNSCVTPTI